MVEATVLMASITSVAAAALYTFVGKRIGRRKAEGEAQRALTLFTVWWYALGATTFIGAFTTIAGSVGALDLELMLTITIFNILLVCVALWGLLYYLLYLFTGSSRILAPLTTFYVAYFALLVYWILASDPLGVEVTKWQVRLTYAAPLEGVLFNVVIVLLVAPQIGAALAYFLLYFRVTDPAQKYRIALVSWSIVVWFGSAFVASLAGLADDDAWQVASRGIGLAAALTVFFAYHPPAAVQRRLDARSAERAVEGRGAHG